MYVWVYVYIYTHIIIIYVRVRVCAWLCLSMSVSAVSSCQVCYVNDGLIFSLRLARTHVSCSHANLDMSNTYATHAHSPHLLLAVCIPSQSDFQEPVRKLFEGNSTWSILKAIRKSHHFQYVNIWWFLARKCSDAWQSETYSSFQCLHVFRNKVSHDPVRRIPLPSWMYHGCIWSWESVSSSVKNSSRSCKRCKLRNGAILLVWCVFFTFLV